MKRKNGFQKKVFVFTLPVLAVLCAACAGGPVPAGSGPPPAWAESMEAAFPGDAYIAVCGADRNSGTVREAALRELSLYFQTHVSSRTDLSESYYEQNSAASKSVQLEQQTFV